jgi:hypothetical protein
MKAWQIIESAALQGLGQRFAVLKLKTDTLRRLAAILHSTKMLLLSLQQFIRRSQTVATATAK